MVPVLDCKIPVGLYAALHEAGVVPEQVLAAAGVTAKVLGVPGPRLPIPEYFALWRAIGEVSGDPNIGITLATSVRPDLTEPLFLAILSACDLRAAVEVIAAYKRILNPEHLELRIDPQHRELRLSYAWPQGTPAIPQTLVDAELAFLVETCRRGTGCVELNPRSVYLPAAGLHPEARHTCFFRCPIHLGAEKAAVAFGEEDASRPFVTSNPELLDALLPYLRARTPPSPHSAVARVKAAIARRLRGLRPTVTVIAKDLAMSSRALQRLLQDHRTSFRQLLDDVRSEHAREYLRSSSFNDCEIAFLLGFEDPSSFYRAFKSWNAQTPSEFRRGLHASGKVPIRTKRPSR